MRIVFWFTTQSINFTVTYIMLMLLLLLLYVCGKVSTFYFFFICLHNIAQWFRRRRSFYTFSVYEFLISSFIYPFHEFQVMYIMIFFLCITCWSHYMSSKILLNMSIYAFFYLSFILNWNWCMRIKTNNSPKN